MCEPDDTKDVLEIMRGVEVVHVDLDVGFYLVDQVLVLVCHADFDRREGGRSCKWAQIL